MSSNSSRPSPVDLSRLHALSAGYVDQSLSSAEFSEFGKLLAEHPQLKHSLSATSTCIERCHAICGESGEVLDGLISAGDGPQAAVDAPTSSPAGTAAPVGRSTFFDLSVVASFVPGGEATVGLLLIVGVLGAFWGVAKVIDGVGRGEPRVAGAPGVDEAGRPSVARLTQKVDCRWAPEDPLSRSELPADRSGIEFEAGRQLDLLTGVAEVVCNSGARLTIEGPARLTLVSPSLCEVHRGRIVALVPPKATGFTVHTSRLTVVDLGTEFGVAVDDQGTDDVTVFRGLVELSYRTGEGTDRDGRSKSGQVPSGIEQAPAVLRLNMGQSYRLEAGATVPRPLDNTRGFVREIRRASSSGKIEASSPVSGVLDLVDLLSGGDGTTNHRGMAFDVRSGSFGRLDPIHLFVGDGQFHPSPTHAVVDGVFVPDGRMAVDSAGHQFDFGPTHRESFNHLFASDRVHWEAGWFSAVLGGVNYARPGHCYLLFHANKGLTIDLAAVRRLHPDRTLRSFKAVVGNTYREPSENQTDIWVLVDGQPRLSRHGYEAREGPIPVEIAFEPQDQFLTLGTAEGIDGIVWDWIIFGNPQFELEPR